MKKLFKLVLFIGSLTLLHLLCKKATDGFAVGLIQKPLSKTLEPNPTLSSPISGILQQKFHYLAKGGQCYVFESENGLYVLKVFKQHHLRLPLWMTKIIPTSLKEDFANKEKHFLESCSIAANDLAEETGVVFLHLEDSPGCPDYITLVDKLHIIHQVPTSHLPFVLQKKATPIFKKLEKLDEAHAKIAIDELVFLVQRRCNKGIADNDPFLDRNFGFIEDRAVEFDIGPYFYSPELKLPEYQRREMFFTLSAFQRRLSKRYPALACHLEQYLNSLLHTNISRNSDE